MFKKKLSTIIIIVILTLINIPFINSAIDEGYGEANDNLGQFVDSFENSDNVTVMVDVINNVTLECMELEYTSAIEVTNDTFQLREHKNYGGGLNPLYTFTIVSDDYLYTDSTTGALGYGYNFFYGDTIFLDNKYLRFRWKYWDTAGSVYSMYLLIYDGSYDRASMVDFPSGSALLEKGAGLLYSKRETTVGRNIWKTWDILINLGSATLDEVTIMYRIVDAWSGQDVQMCLDWVEINTGSGGSGNLWRIDFTGDQDVVMEQTGTMADYGYIDNSGLPIISGGFEDDGYFITTDYLNYTTGNSLALLTNASIPEGTSITVQFSNDNETWLDNEGNVGSTPIEEGFYAIDTRDLNYTISYKMVNFTGTQLLTPRLYQLREVTTNGTAGNGIGNGIVYLDDYAGFLIIGLILGLVIGIGASRS